MTSLAEIKSKADALLRATDDFVSHRIKEEAFQESVTALDQAVRGIKTGVEVGATADKLFRQANLLNTSTKDLITAVTNGGSVEPFKTRVVNGTNNVHKTAQQLIEEGQ